MVDMHKSMPVPPKGPSPRPWAMLMMVHSYGNRGHIFLKSADIKINKVKRGIKNIFI